MAGETGTVTAAMDAITALMREAEIGLAGFAEAG
jgi:pyrimidine operon attenuation protein/uracil phosphoribosyltransferase